MIPMNSPTKSANLDLRFLLFFFWIALLYSSLSIALEIPPRPSGRVNDFAGLLDSASKNELESKLAAFDRQTSNEVVVVTFASLGGESLEDFSIRLAEAWKIGKKGRNNGAVLLIFKNNRKLRIEVGYGLEGALPDAVANSIIQNEIVPRFKNADFKGGIFAGVEAIFKATRGEYKPIAPPYSPSRSSNSPSSLLCFLFPFGMFGLIFLIFFLSKKGGARGYTYSSWGSSGWRGSSGSSWSSGGGGYSGGGGSFGGGGSSGSW